MIRPNLPLAVLLTTLGALSPLACQADLPVLTILHTFASGGPGDLMPSHNANQDGSRPEAALTQAPDGTLYGSTSEGGPQGTGVIFKIKPDGTGFAVLHSFGPLPTLFGNETNGDGGRPDGVLIISKDGVLYGVAGQGGPKGSGTVFKLNPDGSGFTVLHSFEPKGELFQNSGGASPLGLTFGPDSTLIGTAELGGDGRGLIFKMTQDGKSFHVLHLFEEPIYNGSANINKGGAIPNTAIVIGRDGAFYGTANIGGEEGDGVIYKMDAEGKHFAVLHNFRRKGGDYKNNGVFPSGPLIIGSDNFLYGCTRQGGTFDSGVVYKINADGSAFTVLHTFSDPNSDNEDGDFPAGPLALGSDGYIYGVSGGGGETGYGTFFKVNTEGTKFFALHGFSTTEGGSTFSGLTLGRNGSFYGVSTNGGANGTGTIFRITFPAAK